MRIGVVTFPGSCDDRDARAAVASMGAEPVALWHGDGDLRHVDAVVLPGGFSYGDYLRCGAIARFSPVMGAVATFAAAGQVVFRYAPGHNPNGSVGDIAGVRSPAGNVVGLMPHPEHAVDPLLGPTGGRALFESVLAARV